MAQFHNYSWNNQLLIAMQCPTATRVAGFHTWRKMNRFVRKGEKGITILAPCIYKPKKREQPQENESTSRRTQPAHCGDSVRQPCLKDYLVICGRDSTRRWNARRTSGFPMIAAIYHLSFNCPLQRARNGGMLPPVQGVLHLPLVSVMRNNPKSNFQPVNQPAFTLRIAASVLRPSVRQGNWHVEDAWGLGSQPVQPLPVSRCRM